MDDSWANRIRPNQTSEVSRKPADRLTATARKPRRSNRHDDDGPYGNPDQAVRIDTAMVLLISLLRGHRVVRGRSVPSGGGPRLRRSPPPGRGGRAREPTGSSRADPRARRGNPPAPPPCFRGTPASEPVSRRTRGRQSAASARRA